MLLVFGGPHRPALAQAGRTALRRYGFDPAGLEPLSGQGRRSARYLVAYPSSPEQLVKAVTRERRDSSLLYRAWYWLHPDDLRRLLGELEASGHRSAHNIR